MSTERCQGPNHVGSSDPGISLGTTPISLHPFPPKGKTSGASVARPIHISRRRVKNILHLVHPRQDTDLKSLGALAGPGLNPLGGFGCVEVGSA